MAFTFKEEPIPVQQKLNFAIDRFGGVNVNGDISSSEFSSCKNMSGDNFPYASPRASKEVTASGIESPQRLFFCGDKLSYIAGGKLYVRASDQVMDEEVDTGNGFIDIGVPGEVTAAVDFNNQKMLFYPSNMVFDYKTEVLAETENTVLYKCHGYYDRDENFTAYGNEPTENYVKFRGRDLTWISAATFAVSTSESGYGYIEAPAVTDKDGNVVKDDEGKTIYTTMTFNIEGYSDEYSVGDGVYGKGLIRLFVHAYDEDNNALHHKYDDTDYCYFESFKFGEPILFDGKAPAKMCILVGYYSPKTYASGRYEKVYEDEGKAYEDDMQQVIDDVANTAIKIYVSKTEYPGPNSIPNIKYACMDNNRVVAVEGNNFYASSLGSYINWTDFVDADGNPKATGSYAEELYTYGDFTGIVKYSNSVFMTKADMTYICQGNKPPYRINEVCKTGCIDGNSIAEVDGYLYWLGREGVYRFGGGTPILISQKIGTDFTEGVAVGCGHKYYISTKGKLYSYNTQYGFWHVEDDKEYISLASKDGKLYGLTASGEIVQFYSGNERVKWEFVTRRFDFDTEYTKNLSKVYCRMKLFGQANVDIYIKSNKADWFKFASYKAEGETVIQAKVKLKKYDYFQLKFVGVGEAHIMDIYADCVVGSQKHRARNKLNVYKKG